MPVFRFDVLELRFDYAFDPTIFAMEMLQPAGQCHPWFLSPAVAIYARNLLRHGFLDKLLERVPCRAAVAFALRKSASGISSVVFTNDCLPYLWAPSRTAPAAILRRLCFLLFRSHNPLHLGNPWLASLLHFPRNLAPDFTHYLCEPSEVSSHSEKSRKAKTMKGN
ncbi:MAG: hypothetical protein DMF73_14745, partial [Acidobacteria bacterium]